MGSAVARKTDSACAVVVVIPAKLVGFEENGYDATRSRLAAEGDQLVSTVSGKPSARATRNIGNASDDE